jgi:hypothetical protein
LRRDDQSLHEEAATISGVLFTLLFYATFVASERAAARHARGAR